MEIIRSSQHPSISTFHRRHFCTIGEKKEKRKKGNVMLLPNAKRQIQIKGELFPKSYIPLGFFLCDWKFLNILSKEYL